MEHVNKISATIITLNEEKNIGRCLDSLKDIVDEIIVVDSHSIDNTVEICRQKGAKVEIKDWEGYSKTKNHANSLANYNYIFSIDADEAVSDELASSIKKEKEKGLEGTYSMNRLCNYCGKWIKHCGWYPDKKMRIFPKSTTKWQGEIHETLTTTTIHNTHLKGDLLHYSYYTIAEHDERLEKYAELGAKSAYAKGKKSNLVKIVFKPFFKFLKTYFLKAGFLDGYYGLIISKKTSYENYLKYLKLYKLQKTTN